MDEVLKVALTHQPTPLAEGREEVPFQPPISGDPDLQESVMN
jgi:hypothetical protein